MNTKQRTLFSILVLMIILACTPLGLGNTAPGFNPAYADTDGDGFVPAQGDPLYDEHYAKNVNDPNSQAIENLSDAGKTDAEKKLLEQQARQMASDRFWSNIWQTILGFILLVVAVAVVYGILHGARS